MANANMLPSLRNLIQHLRDAGHQGLHIDPVFYPDAREWWIARMILGDVADVYHMVRVSWHEGIFYVTLFDDENELFNAPSLGYREATHEVPFEDILDEVVRLVSLSEQYGSLAAAMGVLAAENRQQVVPNNDPGVNPALDRLIHNMARQFG